MHKITNLWNLSSIGRRSCEIIIRALETLLGSKRQAINYFFEIIIKEKTPLSHEVVCFQMLDFEIWGLEINFVETYFFLENYVTSEGAVSHNVLYHQPLPITPYQVRFYADNYFE